jgi:hypothetical protein
MACELCQSSNESTFFAESNIHFRELRDQGELDVFGFQNVTFCLYCGFARYVLRNR